MQLVSLETVAIDAQGQLVVRPQEPATYDFIYRAALGVDWNPTTRSLVVPAPRERSYFDAFKQVCLAVRSEYGQCLAVSDHTRWCDIPDDLRAMIIQWIARDAA